MHPTDSPRIQKLAQLLPSKGYDSLAIMPGPNLVYLTGIHLHLSERPVLGFLQPEQPIVWIVPSFEAEKVSEISPTECIFGYTDNEGPSKAFAGAIARLTGIKNCGVEARRLRFLESQHLAQATPSLQLKAADALFAELRMRKDEEELSSMRTAVQIAESALTATLPFISPGKTEREVQAELVRQLFRAGSDPDLPFFPIIASGTNGAKPHASASEKPLEPGKLVTIDWGARYEGYCSDLTRTFAIAGKELPSRLVNAYQAVENGNAAGRKACETSPTGQSIDRAARQTIEAAGFGEYFIHRTGHGLGLEEHEEPDIKEGEESPLLPGTTFTVEPGVYIPDLGGIRIEDDLLITETGSESLTTLPRHLQFLGES
ncbi:Xaa-Pro aminopeptidase [Planctomycetales bacterium 10988]|nr:Xaa-Pro aminopeptidase [Planctomycetales bacterium 10988]